MTRTMLSRHICMFLAMIALCSPSKGDLGITCSQHPARLLIKKHVLVRSWEFVGQTSAQMVDGRVAYYPRYGELNYAPKDNPKSKKYKDLDFFYIGGSQDRLRTPSLANIYFQRRAVVYMFVNANGLRSDVLPKSEMPGWKAEGWASLGSDGKTMKYGLYQKSKFEVTRNVFVFSKRTEGSLNSVTLPHFGWVKRTASQLMTKGSYHIRVAESNGFASAPSSIFKGTKVLPNARCPDVLHNAWSRADDDKQDTDTRSKRFGTWHPQWDPCYWCAYDHEHGSAAKFLMGFEPKYGYTEYKNGRNTESNPGFKDFVFKHGNFIIYVSVHIQTSSMRRVEQAFHTVTIAIKSRKGGELMLEMTFKGDFGFLAARKHGRGDQFIPLTPEGERMMKKQRKRKPYVREFRSINVVNVNLLDRRFQYTYPNPMAGTYEEWVVNVPCTKVPRGGELTFDVQDPITGIRSLPGMHRVWLGRVYQREGFRPNLGLKRTVRARELSFSAKLCGFGGAFKGGYFYTDVYGKRLLRGAGPNAVRQYIRPGFETSITGKWHPGGLWKGLHEQTRPERFFLPHGFGINHAVN